MISIGLETETKTTRGLFTLGLHGSHGKESAFNAEDPSLITGSGRFPREGNGYSCQHFVPGRFHGQRYAGAIVHGVLYGTLLNS